MVRSGPFVALVITLASASAASAAPPTPAAPNQTGRAEGTPRGELEFGLASVLVGVGLGLIAVGSIELVRTREHQRTCNAGTGNPGSGIDPCLVDPPGLGYAAVGLAWGFSVPVLVGSGLLFARGARVLREARRRDARVARSGIGPWWNRTGAGVSLTLRF